MRRRRKVARVNTKLIMDGITASLIVQKAPRLLRGIIPIGADVEKLAGVGAGWLTGYFFNRPDISNLSLALGITEYVGDIVDGLIGGGMPIPTSGTLLPGKRLPPVKEIKPAGVADFITLNEYTDDPYNEQSVSSYRDNY